MIESDSFYKKLINMFSDSGTGWTKTDIQTEIRSWKANGIRLKMFFSWMDNPKWTVLHRSSGDERRKKKQWYIRKYNAWIIQLSCCRYLPRASRFPLFTECSRANRSIFYNSATRRNIATTFSFSLRPPPLAFRNASISIIVRRGIRFSSLRKSLYAEDELNYTPPSAQAR